MKNISEPRSVAEWVAEIAANILSHSSFHPLAALGILVNILLVTQGSAADAAPRWAMIMPPCGLKFPLAVGSPTSNFLHHDAKWLQQI